MRMSLIPKCSMLFITCISLWANGVYAWQADDGSFLIYTNSLSLDLKHPSQT
jgi:hypothetical protein